MGDDLNMTPPPEPEFDGLMTPPPEPEFDGLMAPPPEPEFDGLMADKKTSTSSDNKKKNMVIGIAVVAIAIIVGIVIICISIFGNNGSRKNGGLNMNMAIGGSTQSSQAPGQESSQVTGTEASSSVSEEATKEQADKESLDEGGNNPDKVPEGIEVPLAPPTPEEVSDAEWEMRKLVMGIYFARDEEFANGSITEPSIVLGENGTFAMQLNTGHSIENVVGNYSCSIKQSDADDITVTLRVSSSTIDVPKQATIVFEDSLDYCSFMTSGFGIMGYANNGNPPYGFSRIG